MSNKFVSNVITCTGFELSKVCYSNLDLKLRQKFNKGSFNLNIGLEHLALNKGGGFRMGKGKGRISSSFFHITPGALFLSLSINLVSKKILKYISSRLGSVCLKFVELNKFLKYNSASREL
jgi:hypothetical protein